MNPSNEPALNGKHNVSCEVLFFADHICHHYSQYLVTAKIYVAPGTGERRPLLSYVTHGRLR